MTQLPHFAEERDNPMTLELEEKDFILVKYTTEGGHRENYYVGQIANDLGDNQGDSAIQSYGNQLMVAGKTYILTPGLLEPLLKKQPQMSPITPQDWDDYQAMVTSTNTNRKRYLKTGPIRLNTLTQKK